MNQVALIFPDTSSIADFVLENSVSNAEVNSMEQKLTALLSDKQTHIAVQRYGAIILNKPVYHFSDELDD